ncbi:sugar kinase, ribokinase family [Candidatus Koribacter versatilis Ellin345]|uniref:Sugar kinase, ribokinase family n=1 Tax=Koribacter versatilis (strain Ellin345) TaxID=204669 RepID=Q1ITY5_KORVE|nr:carbohydrate kinase family protein [Candidatus Koribacter versatilis]ABF39665.1 sugar kinase, ribokinase family [Candidatus Koribacter versatilis Ellin345]
MALDIAVVGEINLDLILYGLPQEMPLERELLATNFRQTLGSSSAILAHNLSTLGTRVGFTTCVGPDPMGQIALEYLRSAGVDLSHLISSQTTTGVTLLLPHDRDRHILTFPGTMFELKYDHLDLPFLKSASHFHMSSLYLHRGLLPDAGRLFREMKAAGLTTSLDTNDDPDDTWLLLDEIFPHVDIFLPNRQEACRIAQTNDVSEAINRLAERVPMLVVKLGADGALLRKGKEEIRAAGEKVTVVDTVGAGDSFDSGFLHQFLRGAHLQDCLKFGNRTAAYSTTAAGGVEAFRDEKRRKEFLG